APRAHRFAWRHRPEPGGNGRGASLRSQRPQLRGAGIYAAHRGDRPGVSPRLHVRQRCDAPRGRARARRRHRRAAGGDPPVRSRVSSGQSFARWDGALMVTRRQLLQTFAMATLLRRHLGAAASLEYGYAAITWGNDFTKAIDEIAAVGFRGVQLRTGDGLLDRYGDRPAAPREPLAAKRLAVPGFSSGNLSIDPAREQEMIDLHTKHAAFVKA